MHIAFIVLQEQIKFCSLENIHGIADMVGYNVLCAYIVYYPTVQIVL